MKDEIDPVEDINLMQIGEKFCEVFALKFSTFPLSTKLFGVICRSCKKFIISRPTKLLLWFAYLRA